MKISAIIICRNSLDNLRNLLTSLQESLADYVHEIVITDNASTDGTEEYIKAHYPEVKYMRLAKNHGVAYARNRAIERADGELLWILDDDTIVNPTAARELVTYLHAHPHCGIAACALYSSDGRRQQSYKPFPGPWLKLKNILGIPSADPYDSQLKAGAPFEPVYLIGACQMIRSRVIEEIGMLDQEIFYGPEDADFCLRARRRGWQIAYLPQVSIIHHWRRSTTRRPWSPLGRAHLRGLIHFYLKTLFRTSTK